ncbi:unnamed protein product [Mytilus edulis]|uniref:Uncharacterized protein n=1 Tax=Mytilus edulis TaxID=6550 RepID=A0A8S3RHB0_MYTED|nr:unnamed protein product [Mytilus edulis]
MQPNFTGNSQPATGQSTTQATQALPVTISPNSLWQPFLTEETVTLHLPTAGQSTTQSAQQVTVPINPSPMEKDDIPTSDHSRVLEALSSPSPNVEEYDPKRPWMDGAKRRVEFREEIAFYLPRRIQMTATGRGRLYDWSHPGVPTQETLTAQGSSYAAPNQATCRVKMLN